MMVNHLIQSTVFAVLMGLLTLLLRNNRAATRYWVWLAASLKFLIPFSLFVEIGHRLTWTTAPVITQPRLSFVMEQVVAPVYAAGSPAPVVAPGSASSILPALWIFGSTAVLVFWLMRWQRAARVLGKADPITDGRAFDRMRRLDASTRLVSSGSSIEPGVFGILRPVLYVPGGITEHLDDAQLDAIFVHELTHIHRRDNLTAALHMLVEAVFWFHPLVWWMGSKLVEERERACDEEVVRLGSDPETYAESILKICRHYLESPLACVSGVTGSDLRRRIEVIMASSVVSRLNFPKKSVLAIAAGAALALPVSIGLLNVPGIRAQTISPTLTFEVASVRLAPPPDGRTPARRSSGIPGPGNNDPGRFSARLDLLDLVLIAYDIPSYRLSEQSDLYLERVDVEAKMPVNTTREQFNVMLQNLLADRLGLKVHWATRQIDTYALVVAKGGPKFRTAAPDSPEASDDTSTNSGPDKTGPNGFPIPPPGNGRWRGATPGGKIGMRGHNETVSELASAIASQTLGAPMTDATGLTGKYDYTIFWSVTATTAARRGTQTIDDPDGPSIFDAVQEQLGLKIEKRKGPVEMLVVDHVEKKPTGN